MDALVKYIILTLDCIGLVQTLIHLILDILVLVGDLTEDALLASLGWCGFHSLHKVHCFIKEPTLCLKVHQLSHVELLILEFFNIQYLILLTLQGIKFLQKEINLSFVPLSQPREQLQLLYILTVCVSLDSCSTMALY